MGTLTKKILSQETRVLDGAYPPECPIHLSAFIARERAQGAQGAAHAA
jgi:hypothetical protein